jgi:hypothetical protein
MIVRDKFDLKQPRNIAIYSVCLCAARHHSPTVLFESNFSTAAPHAVIKSAAEYWYKAHEDGNLLGVANVLIIFASTPSTVITASVLGSVSIVPSLHFREE